MVQPLPESDEKILKRLRQPINDLLNRYCLDFSLENKMRLRQLAWYAVDILIDTDDVVNFKYHKDILKISENIKAIGASNHFIEESLNLALSIYNRMKSDYPALLKRYKA